MKKLSKEELNEIEKVYPNTYTGDAYGNLRELYDKIKDIGLKNYEYDREYLRRLFFEIKQVTNEVRDYAKTTELKIDKLDNIYRLTAVINNIKNNIKVVSDNDISDVADAFDFELDKHKTKKKPLKFIEGASEIDKKFEQIIKPKSTAGAPLAECKETIKLISNLDNNNKKIALVNLLVDNYSKLPIADFNSLLAVLRYKKFIDFNNHKNLTIQLSFEKLLKPIGYENVENGNNVTAQADSNFNDKVPKYYDLLFNKIHPGNAKGLIATKRTTKIYDLYNDLNQKMGRNTIP